MGTTHSAESWRKLLEPDELAAFDSGQIKWETDPDRISRNSREVSYNEQYAKHQPAYDSELLPDHQTALDTIGVLADRDADCVICGAHLKTQADRATLVIHKGDEDNAIVYCYRCLLALNIPIEPKNWREGLSELHLKVWELRQQGLTHEDIAVRLTNQHQRLTRKQVSRILREIQERQHHSLAPRKH